MMLHSCLCAQCSHLAADQCDVHLRADAETNEVRKRLVCRAAYRARGCFYAVSMMADAHVLLVFSYSSSVTLSDPDADGRISFAVATRVACPGGAFATASQVSSEPSQYTQGNTPPEQVAMTRNKQRTR